MSQALYRKYRSRSLAEVVGQEHITETLARAIQAGHIGHAYLFTGPRGTGKTSVARILANEINGLTYSETPNLDIIEIDAASNRRIDDIRDLREKVHIAPVHAKYKVYIIDEVHMLTGESFNALLKTLEEPPAHVVFILATTEVHKLPATIISRTQRFSFRLGTKEKIMAHLKMIAKKEKIAIDDSALELIAEHGEGSFRDSLSLLDQLAHISSGQVTAEQVASTLGLAPKEHIAQLVEALTTHDTASIMNILSSLEEQGGNSAALVNQLCKALLQVVSDHPDFFDLIDKLLEVPRAYNPQLKLITVLTTHTLPSKNAPLKSSPALAATSTPAVIAKITTDDAPMPAETTQKIVAPHHVLLVNFTPQQWADALALTKQKSLPMFAILKQAQPIVEEGALVLKFKFSLMAKKLDDPKQKAFVAEVIGSVAGQTPAIKVVVDKTATPPLTSDDPHITSVAEIMGGGEVLHGETI